LPIIVDANSTVSVGSMLGVGSNITRLLLRLCVTVCQVVGAAGTVIAGTPNGIAPSNTGNNLLCHLPGLPMPQEGDLHVQSPDFRIAGGVGYYLPCATWLPRCHDEGVAQFLGKIFRSDASS
jgi:hypothetical protein